MLIRRESQDRSPARGRWQSLPPVFGLATFPHAIQLTVRIRVACKDVDGMTDQERMRSYLRKRPCAALGQVGMCAITMELFENLFEDRRERLHERTLTCSSLTCSSLATAGADVELRFANHFRRHAIRTKQNLTFHSPASTTRSTVPT
jgi:hypothetical protein